MAEQRNLSVSARLHLMLALVIVSGVFGVVGAIELKRGADMHKLNFLHVKFNHEFSREVEAFSLGQQIDTNFVRGKLLTVRQQPIDCLDFIGTLEHWIMEAIGTERAIELCELDINVANQSLDEIQLFKQGSLSKIELVKRLKAATRKFDYHSAEFEPLAEKTVSTVSRVVMWAVVVKAILLALCGVLVSRSVARDYVRLKRAELSLKEDIQRRKRAETERDELNLELRETARRAGMAEVATGVLHNVGNVLNSLNVSTVLLRQRIRSSPVAALKKTADAISAESGNLGDFLTTDERGRRLPELICKLATAFAKDRDLLLEEFHDLTKSVDHIKAIVFSQQAYAKRKAMLESFDPIELFEDAIRMNATSLRTNGIVVIREFDACGRLVLQEHSVLQILVNLLKNAQQAFEQADKEDPCIRLSLTHKHDFVCFTVTDNGVGISPENISNVFSHGFTTKETGHGFGLHACANSAQEMGGSLCVRSEGCGKGCTFELKLPSPVATPRRPAVGNRNMYSAACRETSRSPLASNDTSNEILG